MNIVEVFDNLENGSGAKKRKSIDWIDALTDSELRSEVNRRLKELIKGKFAAPPNRNAESFEHADVRAWLLSALGKTGEGDAESTTLLTKHANKEFEPSKYCRYWTLEGVATSNHSEKVNLATIAQNDEDEQVRYLAAAILAQSGDQASLEKFTIKDNRERDAKPITRALRVVLLDDRELLEWILELVKEGEFTDPTYDAIVALSKLKPSTKEADEATDSLIKFARTHRWPMYDSMNCKAFTTLAVLGSKRAVPLLLEEVLNDNPLLVRRAAQSLEKLLGTQQACRQIIHEACGSGKPPSLYADALRALPRGEVVNELQSQFSSDNSRKRDVATQLLTELGGIEAFDRLRALRRTSEEFLASQNQAEQQLAQSLDRTLVDARRGYRVVLRMDVALFSTGIALLAFGIVVLLSSQDYVSKIIAGSSSVAGLVVTILKWFQNIRNTIEPTTFRIQSLQTIQHGYLRQLRQIDQVFMQRLLDSKVDQAEVTKFIGNITDATTKANDAIQKLYVKAD